MALVLDGDGSITGFSVISVDSAFNIGTVQIRDSSGAASFKDSDGNSIAIKAGNIITTGYIRGPSTFTIDPAAHGDSTGTVRILGGLTVEGTTTTINSSTLTVDDLNITLADGALDAAAADGAGITIDGASATLTYNSTPDAWSFNKNLGIGTASPSTTLAVQRANTAATTNFASKTISAIAPIVGGYTGAPLVSLYGGFDGTIHAVDMGYSYDATGYRLHLSTNNDTTGDPTIGLTIDRDQNVGIGTVSPSSYTNYSTLTLQDTTGGEIDFRNGSSQVVGAIYNTASTLTIASDFSNVVTSSAISFTIDGSERMHIDGNGNVGIAGTPASFGGGVATLQLKGLSSSQPTRAGALRFISNNGTSCNTAIYSDNGFMSFYTGTSTSQNLNLQIDAYGGLNIKSVAGTQAATFGGSNLVNGITALPSAAGTPFVVGRDTGSLKSATFAGHVNINTGYGLSFDGGANYLDDYEEGTWTPVIGGSTGTSGQSYSTQVGNYTKIGRQVIVTFLVDLSNKGTITGDCILSGLPFACLNTNGSGSGVISYFDNLTANVSSMSLNGNQNNTSAYINHVVGSGATATVNTTAIIGTSTRLDGVFSYFTSA